MTSLAEKLFRLKEQLHWFPQETELGYTSIILKEDDIDELLRLYERNKTYSCGQFSGYECRRDFKNQRQGFVVQKLGYCAG